MPTNSGCHTAAVDDPMLNKIDLQLLAHLEALIDERHVTRAADRMGIGQPAMSGILARLRTIVGDPLLVRSSQGMVPTPRALEVVAQVRSGVELIRSALAAPTAFDPGTAVRDFRVLATDSLALLLLPPLLAYFETHAPGIRIGFRPADMRMTREALEGDQADLVISYLPEPPTGLHASVLFPQPLCTIASDSHPDIQGSLSLAQFVAWPHVVFGAGATPFSSIESDIDRALRARKLQRTVGTRVPNALLVPSVVAATQMLATVSERVARRFASMTPIQLLTPPLQLPLPEILMVWHERTHRDAGQRWLRSVIRRRSAQL
jgi:DNA-binding transcriptional LysR family regulator